LSQTQRPATALDAIGHFLQAMAPCPFETSVSEHGVHAIEPNAAENVPKGHSWQAVEPCKRESVREDYKQMGGTRNIPKEARWSREGTARTLFICTKLWSSKGFAGAAPLSWLVLLSILPLAHTEQLVAPASEYEPAIVYKTRSLDKHQKSEKYRLNRGCTPQQVQQRIDLQAKMSCSVQQET
jgi:hypothetical protein